MFPVGAALVCRRTDSVPLCSWGAQGHTGTKPPAWAGVQGFTPRVSAAGLYSLAHPSAASFFSLSPRPVSPLLLLSFSRCFCFPSLFGPVAFASPFLPSSSSSCSSSLSFARAAPFFGDRYRRLGLVPCDPGDDSAIYLGEILDYILYGWVLTNQCVLV